MQNVILEQRLTIADFGSSIAKSSRFPNGIFFASLWLKLMENVICKM
jgi:hypothetical protein